MKKNSAKKSGKLEEIAKQREAIDEIDTQIVSLLAKRIKKAAETGSIKKKAGIPLVDSTREAEVLDRVASLAGDRLDNRMLRGIYSQIIQAARSVQHATEVGSLRAVGKRELQHKISRRSKMRQMWVKADPWNKELVTAALENGADAVIVPPENVDDVRSLGRIAVVSAGGDIVPDEDVVEMEIESEVDEDAILAESARRRVIVKTTNWRIIPLENLVARSDNIFVEVKNPEEARTACGVLEKGVAGIVVTVDDPASAGRMVRDLKEEAQLLELEELSICRIISLGMGDRVCVDTCTLMSEGEGILVGNNSSVMFLVQAESLENQYVAPRPFRINAGAVHCYTLTGTGTKYLSELSSGHDVQIVSTGGSTATAVVGRAKVERRPLLLVEAEGRCGKGGIVLQNAETVRLVKPSGEAVSVAALAVGDRVLGRFDEGGRHFGMPVNERISER